MKSWPIGIGFSLGVASAAADPFFARYDANEVYPEDAGWSRFRYDPSGLQRRTLNEGILTLDDTASDQIYDFYSMRDSALSLGPGEQLLVTWRMQTLVDTWELDNRSDVALGVVGPSGTFVHLNLGTDRVAHDENRNNPDAEVVAFFAPLEYHTFAFATPDYQNFTLSVDGIEAFSGIFPAGGIPTDAGAFFGDFVVGASSIAEWDFIEIAVVPEVSSSLMTLSIGLLSFRRGRLEHRSTLCGVPVHG